MLVQQLRLMGEGLHRPQDRPGTVPYGKAIGQLRAEGHEQGDVAEAAGIGLACIATRRALASRCPVAPVYPAVHSQKTQRGKIPNERMIGPIEVPTFIEDNLGSGVTPATSPGRRRDGPATLTSHPAWNEVLRERFMPEELLQERES